MNLVATSTISLIFLRITIISQFTTFHEQHEAAQNLRQRIAILPNVSNFANGLQTPKHVADVSNSSKTLQGTPMFSFIIPTFHNMFKFLEYYQFTQGYRRNANTPNIPHAFLNSLSMRQNTQPSPTFCKLRDYLKYLKTRRESSRLPKILNNLEKHQEASNIL